MATRTTWLLLAGLAGQACLADPLEGTGRGAEDGTRVEVMLVPLDEGASVSEGAAAFDDQLPTTESLEDLARGNGAFVVGVADGWGLALVPTSLTDSAAAAAANSDDSGEGAAGQEDRGGEPRPDPEDSPETDAPGACAADCDEWCSTTLDLCGDHDAASCDCSTDDAYGAPGADDEEPACAWDCDEWCTTTLEHCGGDGATSCDCADDGYADPEEPACTWDCDEWCTTWTEYCGGDGAEACGDTCAWTEARPLPASASAGGWVAPIVVGGVALVIVLTDYDVQTALDRGESIGDAVGGVYGRRAREIMQRLRQVSRETGQIVDDAQRPCADLLTRRGFREQAEVDAGRLLIVGICSQDQLTVWPQSITVRAGRFGSTGFTFSNLGSGLRTVLTRDATVSWTEQGSQRSVVVPEGSGVQSALPIAAGSSFEMTVAVPRDSSSTRISVTVTP